MRTVFTILVFSFLLILEINLYSSSTGVSGLTKRDGGIGCVCHGFYKPAPQVSVFFVGPDSALPGQTITYRIKLAHGPAIKGGFDVASFAGTIDTVSSDTTVKRQSGELTHRFPKTFINDTVFWTFKYTAPITPQYDTLYAVANSTDNNGIEDTTDQWNFSANFPVRVGIPIGIINNQTTANTFLLGQNYPNPFNSSSKFKVQSSKFGRVKITIYDALGKEVETIHELSLQPGTYEFEWDGKDNPSGVYFYQLSIINPEHSGLSIDYLETKRMVLIK